MAEAKKENTSDHSQDTGKINSLADRRTKLQTLLEKSWRFYYRVAVKVWKKFSDGDRQATLDAGRRLFNVGAKYIHEIVDPRIPVGKKAAKRSLSPSSNTSKESQKGG